MINQHNQFYLFQAIMGGVAGFWGGVFSMGSIYLMMVAAKRVFNPGEGDKEED